MRKDFKKTILLLLTYQYCVNNCGMNINNNNEQERLKEEKINKNISPGNTIIGTFDISEKKNVFIFGEDTISSKVKKRIEKIIITAENNNSSIEIYEEEIKNTHDFHSAGIYIIYYHIKEEEKDDLSAMFYNCKYLRNVDFSNFDHSKTIYINHLCCNCHKLKNIKFNNKIKSTEIKDMGHMFCECRSLTAIDFYTFDTQKCENMENMFYGCISLRSLKNFHLSQCEETTKMFEGCVLLTEKPTTQTKNLCSVF